jgi:hypothetical protein
MGSRHQPLSVEHRQTHLYAHPRLERFLASVAVLLTRSASEVRPECH